jgi:hypothetical protein
MEHSVVKRDLSRRLPHKQHSGTCNPSIWSSRMRRAVIREECPCDRRRQPLGAFPTLGYRTMQDPAPPAPAGTVLTTPAEGLSSTHPPRRQFHGRLPRQHSDEHQALSPLNTNWTPTDEHLTRLLSNNTAHPHTDVTVKSTADLLELTRRHIQHYEVDDVSIGEQKPA